MGRIREVRGVVTKGWTAMTYEGGDQVHLKVEENGSARTASMTPDEADHLADQLGTIAARVRVALADDERPF